MEINKTLTTSKFSYRVEQKPEGGFIAHPSDDKLETLEAPTREELIKKIQEKTAALIDAKISDFNIGGLNVKVNKTFKLTQSGASGAVESTSQVGPQEPPLENESDKNAARLRVVLFVVVVIAALAYFFLRRG